MPRAFYFGCWDRAGHFVHDGRGVTMYDPPPGCPWSLGNMDGGLLTNGNVPYREDGRVFWTCGGKPALWFAFVWWDNSVDGRGASNSGFYVDGFAIGEAAQAFKFASDAFPGIVKRQRHPLTLQAAHASGV